MKNKTWSLVPLPKHKSIVGNKWIYRLKRNPDGTIQKCKGNTCYKGYTLQQRFDFNETFSSVVKPTSISVISTIVLHMKGDIRQLDMNNAFLNGELQKEVYMEQPRGFTQPNKSEIVCKLHKAIDGSKQAPRVWFDKLKTTLFGLGYQRTKSSNSLFAKFRNSIIYIPIY